MYLLTIAAFIAVCDTAKLDRSYLPPPLSANTAGGRPEDLLTPLVRDYNQGPDNIPAGGFNNEFQGVVVDAVGPETRNSYDETGLGLPRPAYGSLNSKVGEAAFAVQNTPGFHEITPGTDTDNVNSFLNTSPDSSKLFKFKGDDRPLESDDHTANILKSESDVRPDSYKYSFETDNGIAAEENGVDINGIQAQGGYSYKSNDGQVYSVSYTAGEGGYQPKGDHLPTPHPIPEEILRSIEQNAKEEAAGNFDDGTYDAEKYNADRDYMESDQSSQNNGQFDSKTPDSNNVRLESDAATSDTFINENEKSFGNIASSNLSMNRELNGSNNKFKPFSVLRQEPNNTPTKQQNQQQIITEAQNFLSEPVENFPTTTTDIPNFNTEVSVLKSPSKSKEEFSNSDTLSIANLNSTNSNYNSNSFLVTNNQQFTENSNALSSDIAAEVAQSVQQLRGPDNSYIYNRPLKPFNIPRPQYQTSKYPNNKPYYFDQSKEPVTVSENQFLNSDNFSGITQAAISSFTSIIPTVSSQISKIESPSNQSLKKPSYNNGKPVSFIDATLSKQENLSQNQENNFEVFGYKNPEMAFIQPVNNVNQNIQAFGQAAFSPMEVIHNFSLPQSIDKVYDYPKPTQIINFSQNAPTEKFSETTFSAMNQQETDSGYESNKINLSNGLNEKQQEIYENNKADTPLAQRQQLFNQGNSQFGQIPLFESNAKQPSLSNSNFNNNREIYEYPKPKDNIKPSPETFPSNLNIFNNKPIFNQFSVPTFVKPQSQKESYSSGLSPQLQTELISQTSSQFNLPSFMPSLSYKEPNNSGIKSQSQNLLTSSTQSDTKAQNVLVNTRPTFNQQLVNTEVSSSKEIYDYPKPIESENFQSGTSAQNSNTLNNKQPLIQNALPSFLQPENQKVSYKSDTNPQLQNQLAVQFTSNTQAQTKPQNLLFNSQPTLSDEQDSGTNVFSSNKEIYQYPKPTESIQLQTGMSALNPNTFNNNQPSKQFTSSSLIESQRNDESYSTEINSYMQNQPKPQLTPSLQVKPQNLFSNSLHSFNQQEPATISTFGVQFGKKVTEGLNSLGQNMPENNILPSFTLQQNLQKVYSQNPQLQFNNNIGQNFPISKPTFSSQSVAGKGEMFGGPREPPRFDETGYHY